jgi:hypothetical protein
MSKRDLNLSVGVVHPEGPRTKRRREESTVNGASTSYKKDADHADVPEKKAEEVVDKEVVKKQGMQLWQTIKDAVGQE